MTIYPYLPTVDEAEIRRQWLLSPHELAGLQVRKFNAQLAEIIPANAFYRDKLGAIPPISSLEDLAALPFTTKDELVGSQAEFGLSRHHTFHIDRYCRVHRTSGTRGAPLIIMDTHDDWQWWANTWQHVLTAGELTSADRVFLAFSFGPFIGFWSAHEACSQRGCMVIPGGGLSSEARLEFMRQTRPTVLACTPTYALQLAQVASESRIPIESMGIHTIIVAGEPGGSLPGVRNRIETAWNARVIDHCGATELGPWAFGFPHSRGGHVIESAFIAELIPPERIPASATSSQYGDGDLKELVITSLGRTGAPLIRYRTGDLVRAERPTDGPCRFLRLPEGIIGRADDMVIIRGVNIFPSSIDAIVRRFAEVLEYRVLLTRRGELDELCLEVEAPESTAASIIRECELQMGLRIPTQVVPPGSLPRSEAKSKRWQDMRVSPNSNSAGI